MSTLQITTPAIGLPQIQRAAFSVLFNTLNDAVDLVEAAWHADDMAFAEHTGREYVETLIERLPNDNFHEGPRPSLLKSKPSEWPAVAVYAHRGGPNAQSGQMDHQDVYVVSLSVDLIVKADNEEQVDRRFHRTLEAVNACLGQHQTLGGIVAGFDGPPSVTTTNSFVKDARNTRGPVIHYKGGSAEYMVRKDAMSLRPLGAASFLSTDPYAGTTDQD